MDPTRHQVSHQSMACRKLQDLAKDVSFQDTLHNQAMHDTGCTSQRCVGSLMRPHLVGRAPKAKEELTRECTDFLNQYFTAIQKQGSPTHEARLKLALESIHETGTYDLTKAELAFGVKTAWRNSARCIGRIQWSRLQLFDARSIETAAGMFQSICEHIKFGTNNGNLRSAITVFKARTDGDHDFQVWNSQLIGYAGYENDDGTITGDPGNVEFTKLCVNMGWNGIGGRFDILPLILQANGDDPELFEIPEDIVLEVKLTHPQYPWFEDLGLKWYALPAVANVLADIGGLEFTAAPFNGWYMGTEIGSRDLCDPFRYNITEAVGKMMQLDMTTSQTLWRDKAIVEVNRAVLHSFNSQGVTIVDHHSASSSFMKHFETEMHLRGGCPSDWVWVVPPISGSLCPVFHLEMLNYKLKPSFESQTSPLRNYVWKERNGSPMKGPKTKRNKVQFQSLATAVRWTVHMMRTAYNHRVPCTILYATETGRSEHFARVLADTFSHAFHPTVYCMKDYHASMLEHESVVLIVTSTFGNGDPPENGMDFYNELLEMKRNASESAKRCLHPTLCNLLYGVFALGSSVYHKSFCQFGKVLDSLLGDVGGHRMVEVGIGDEMGGQEDAFNIWRKHTFGVSCDILLGDSISPGLFEYYPDNTWKPGKYRLQVKTTTKRSDDMSGVSHIVGKPIFATKVISVTHLKALDSDNQTLLVKLKTGSATMDFMPGDHIGIMPNNRPELVDDILNKLDIHSNPDTPIQIEVARTTPSPNGVTKTWEVPGRLPVCTVREALTRYLDITTPPTPYFLTQMAPLVTDEQEKVEFLELAQGKVSYDDWCHEYQPTVADALGQFPSLRVPAAFLLHLLPLLKPRYYSMSSSNAMFPGEIHLTVAVVRFNNADGIPRHGVCSNWLAGLSAGNIVPGFVRSPNHFHMPEKDVSPVIMVGPGAGIAPFRSFWQQRKVDIDKNGSQYGEMTLYFGCRTSGSDNLHAAERDIMTDLGVLGKNYTAFSREPGREKVYVQHMMLQNGSDVYRAMLEQEGHLYVCGDIDMANDIRETLSLILQRHSNMDEDQAATAIDKLKESKRYHEDIFGTTLKTNERRTEARRLSRQMCLEKQKSSEDAGAAVSC